MRKDDALGAHRHVAGQAEPHSTGTTQGLVFDFSGRKSPDIQGLSLVLTARMIADRDDRPVWVRALPLKTWEVLHSLGLANLFRLFPSSGGNGN